MPSWVRKALALHHPSHVPPKWISSPANPYDNKELDPYGPANDLKQYLELDMVPSNGLGPEQYLRTPAYTGSDFVSLTASPGPDGATIFTGDLAEPAWQESPQLVAEIDSRGRLVSRDTNGCREEVDWTPPTIRMPNVDNSHRAMVLAEDTASRVAAHKAWRANNQAGLDGWYDRTVSVRRFIRITGIARDQGNGVECRKVDISRGIRITCSYPGWKQPLDWKVVVKNGKAVYFPVPAQEQR